MSDTPPSQLDLFAAKGQVALYEGDNVGVMAALRQSGTKVQLAYLDPPFFTQRKHQRTHRRRDVKTGRMARTHSQAFDDRWESLEIYLAALRERIGMIHSLLSNDGCMVLHVPPTISHYVKIMCDEVFGRDAFASEIIWRYRRWPAKTKNFQRVHDVLLRYVRDPDEQPRFNQLYEPLAASTLATWGDSKQLADFEDGKRIRSTKTRERSPGTPMGDVWEISVIAPIAKERTGYPTQKPIALLKRILEACSHKGDLVLDPYMGSGTTLLAAAQLGRQAIGIDASEEAIAVAMERLEREAVLTKLSRSASDEKSTDKS